MSIKASILALLTSSTMLSGCSKLQLAPSPPQQLRYSKVLTRSRPDPLFSLFTISSARKI